MADFTADLQSFKPPFPFLDIDASMAAINQFTEVNQAIQLDDPIMDNFHSFPPFTSNTSLLNHQNSPETLPGVFFRLVSIKMTKMLCPFLRLSPHLQSKVNSKKAREEQWMCLKADFLSMKLTAASTFYDFNAETDAIETVQRAKAQETKELQRAMREGSGGHAQSHSSWPP
ncbi:hypothetical protein D5086_028085 [Populus alba]|uniref:Uncharacterized protein n=1 Tax=Populus alba TaxID=43335 RepID=A0ACC4AX90_POPAL